MIETFCYERVGATQKCNIAICGEPHWWSQQMHLVAIRSSSR